MRVESIMTRNPVSVLATASLHDACSTMEHLGVRHLPVVGDNGAVIGMISDQEVRKIRVPLGAGTARFSAATPALRQPVTSVMNPTAPGVLADDEVARAVDVMLEHHAAAIPVLDGRGELTGLLTYEDILRRCRCGW